MFSSSSSSSNTRSKESADPIIGVEVSGKVFYFHRSKLLQCGSTYFSSRLSGKWDEEVLYRDDRGRKVIYLGRSPSLFEHISNYILSQKLHLETASMDLRRALREEALYLGMDPLLEELKVCRSFSPSAYNQGVLYWLGTKRGTAPYQNPYAIGAVHVGGWVDQEPKPQRQEEEDINLSLAEVTAAAKSAGSRQAFVHYRQSIPVKLGDRRRIDHTGTFWCIESPCKLLWCDHAIQRLPVEVVLNSIQLRPTHYSLRASKCYGMHGDWNLEASQDGQEWDILHAARNDRHLYIEVEDHIRERVNRACMSHDVEHRTEELCTELLLGVLEEDHRHTWELDPPPTKYYSHFRIIGAGSTTEEDNNNNNNMQEDDDQTHAIATCLHGEGFELFGDVYVE